MGVKRHAPAALPLGKTRYPLYRRLGGPQGRSGWVRKISPPPGFDPRTAQPVASRYTVCAIPALLNSILGVNQGRVIVVIAGSWRIPIVTCKQHMFHLYVDWIQAGNQNTQLEWSCDNYACNSVCVMKRIAFLFESHLCTGL